MIVSAIAAVAQNRVIGANNDLIWRLPNDLKFFKKHTSGHAIIMGRKTWESMNGRPLPKRTNIIVTRNPEYQAEGGVVVTSIEAAIEKARELDETELFVIGGGEIYRQSMPLLNQLYYTHVHAEVPGDTYFPEVNWPEWRELERTDYPADERHDHAFSTAIYEKIG